MFSLEYFGPISLPHMCIQLASKVIYAYYWSSHSMFCYYIQKIFLSYLEKVVPHFVWEFLITAALLNPLRYWEYTRINCSLPKSETSCVGKSCELRFNQIQDTWRKKRNQRRTKQRRPRQWHRCPNWSKLLSPDAQQEQERRGQEVFKTPIGNCLKNDQFNDVQSSFWCEVTKEACYI